MGGAEESRGNIKRRYKKKRKRKKKRNKKSSRVSERIVLENCQKGEVGRQGK